MLTRLVHFLLLLLLAAGAWGCSSDPVPSQLDAARRALIAGQAAEALARADQAIALAASLAPEERDAALFDACVVRTRALCAGRRLEVGLAACGELFDQHRARIGDGTLDELADSLAHWERARFEGTSLDPTSFLAPVLATEAVRRPAHGRLYAELATKVQRLRPITDEKRGFELDLRPDFPRR